MADATLDAKVRTEFGKGSARRTRREGLIPAVLYGHGTEPEHLALPGHATEMAMRIANALLELNIEGESESKLALPKQIQRHPVRSNIMHIDLILVRRGQKVVVEVPITVVGEAAAETMVITEMATLEVEAEATNIPTGFEVSVEGLEIGSQILAQDVILPEGVTIAGDPEALVVNVTAQISEEELEADLAVAGEEDVDAVEVEGVEDEAAEAVADEGEAAEAADGDEE